MPAAYAAAAGQHSQFIPRNTKNPSTIWVWKFKFFNDDQMVSIHNIDISMLASGKNHLPYKISEPNKGGTVKNGWLLFSSLLLYTSVGWHGMDWFASCSLKFEVSSEERKKIYKLTNDWIPTPRTIIDTWVVNRTFVRSHFNFIQCAHVWILEIQIYLWLLSQAINRLLSNKTKKNLNWQMFQSTWTHSRT